MIINRSEASRRLNISRQAMDKMTKKNPLPGYLVEVNGVLKVDTENPEWLMKVEKKGFDNQKTTAKRADLKGAKNPAPAVRSEKSEPTPAPPAKKKVKKLLNWLKGIILHYQKMNRNYQKRL